MFCASVQKRLICRIYAPVPGTANARICHCVGHQSQKTTGFLNLMQHIAQEY